MAEPSPGLWKIVLGVGVLLALIAFVLGMKFTKNLDN
jgi:hypothetical protein